MSTVVARGEVLALMPKVFPTSCGMLPAASFEVSRTVATVFAESLGVFKSSTFTAVGEVLAF